jgi:hypothetical protein
MVARHEQQGVPPFRVVQPVELFAAMQNSLPSGSCMTVKRGRPPPIWCSSTMGAPKATNRSTTEGVRIEQVQVHGVLRDFQLRRV